MHELAITRSIIDLVEGEAKKQGFKKALEILVRAAADMRKNDEKQ